MGCGCQNGGYVQAGVNPTGTAWRHTRTDGTWTDYTANDQRTAAQAEVEAWTARDQVGGTVQRVNSYG